MKKHFDLFKEFRDVVNRPVSTSGVPQHLLSLVKLRKVLSSRRTTIQELSEFADHNAYVILALLTEANLNAQEHQYHTHTEAAISFLGLERAKRIIRRAIWNQLQNYGRDFLNDDLYRRLWLRSLYVCVACEVIAQDTKEVSVKEARMCGTLLFMGGLYLLYRINRFRNSAQYTEDIKYLIHKHYLDTTIRILKDYKLPKRIMDAFFIDRIDVDSLEYPPKNLKEVLYIANSLVDNSVLWSEDVDFSTFVVSDYMALTDRISTRYAEVRALYV